MTFYQIFSLALGWECLMILFNNIYATMSMQHIQKGARFKSNLIEIYDSLLHQLRSDMDIMKQIAIISSIKVDHAKNKRNTDVIPLNRVAVIGCATFKRMAPFYKGFAYRTLLSCS